MAYANQLQHEIESNIATLFLQIVFILCLCRLVGRVLQPLKQPPVVGEIIAGIIMGPTLIGQSAEFKNFMFPARGAVLLKGLSDLGITFFMFILGLEFAPGDMLRTLKKTWLIGVAGIILPFGLGAAIADYLYDATNMVAQVPPVSRVSFFLFTGASMSFTAFPVLARILTANNAMTSQIGLVSMGVSSVDDVLAWTVLAIATSVTAGGSPQDGAWGILIGIAWVIFLLVVVRKLLVILQPVLSASNFVVLVFLGMCVSAWITQVLGLHAFFGGFIFGLCIPKEDKTFVHQFIDQLEVVVVNFFVPLFFANTGLRTDLTKLKSSVGPVLLVWALATAGKMIPPFFLGKCRGYTWRFSFQLAALMNARGLIALIALEVALEVKAFNNEMYSIFVVMALGTTIMAGPMFWASYRRELDPPTGRELAALKHSETTTGIQSPPLTVRQPSVVLPEDPDENIAIEESVCRELPVEAQIDPAQPAVKSYGYLFQGTVKPVERTESRKSIVEAFSFLNPKTPRDTGGPGSPTPAGGLRLRHTVSEPRMPQEFQTPKFDSLRSPEHIEMPEMETPPAIHPAVHPATHPDVHLDVERTEPRKSVVTAQPDLQGPVVPNSILRTMTLENKQSEVQPDPTAHVATSPS
jgi:Kef-type K+ transport system membrane component KefB